MYIMALIHKLCETHNLSEDELIYLIDSISSEDKEYLFKKASQVRDHYYGNKIFLRGLIEFTNYCKNDCYYCGIRCSNKNIDRYRLSLDDILECCKIGYKLGFKTFVLQGGEDPFFTDDKLINIIKLIKENYNDCAITLSLGERSYDSYKKLFDAGADRYLLRHETACEKHYSKLHPENLNLYDRKKCLLNLKEIGFQVGAGFMVESPFQTTENLAKDLRYLKELDPHMVGIGPFIPHHDTPFKNEKAGSLDKTLLMLAITRLLLPKVLLPATTALGTISNIGRELGLKAGANVIMPNLSPKKLRKKYSLYNNKVGTGDEAAESKRLIEEKINNAGFILDDSRGDNISQERSGTILNTL